MMAVETEGLSPRRGSSKRWRAACFLFVFMGSSSLLVTTFMTEDQVQRFQAVLLRQNQVAKSKSKAASSISISDDDNATIRGRKQQKKLAQQKNATKTTTTSSRLRPAPNQGKKNKESPLFVKAPPQNSISITSDAHKTDPRIAWLMSFPNSGTSYTGQLVKHLTRTKTASNYGEQNLDLQGSSVPVYHDGNKKQKDRNWQGPFYVDPTQSKGYETPHAYVLTKTHCGGYTTNTSPERYVEATHSFRRRCLSTRYVKNGTLYKGEYDAALVHKAIHLFRNPFDNVVSRFNFEHKRLEKKKGYTNGSTKSREGFRAFCQQMDTTWKESERNSIVYEDSILAKMESVPCHSDFFRYVEWHNLAFVTTQDLGIETMILHYEDYGASTFETTKNKLLEFLELEERGVSSPFKDGKVYSKEYFTKKEREVVKEVLQQLALKTTWGYLERYF
ncbi:expressed unknown protein [Seminavis robusta]|uniref:Sulfotransferase domain-containing protein n=1 Tax=Seminavis robusta TaxID=568900 RepID=A0A9N8DDP7_9STRA|nr:expressed unknown protein [Seminavis robusta]|eukprot:Sro71_g039490.1 n/a (446) ;mRNA; f:93581-94918